MMIKKKFNFDVKIRKIEKQELLKKNRLNYQLKPFQYSYESDENLLNQIEDICSLLLISLQNKNVGNNSVLIIKIHKLITCSDSNFRNILASKICDSKDDSLFFRLLKENIDNYLNCENLIEILASIFLNQKCNISFSKYDFFGLFKTLLKNAHSELVLSNVKIIRLFGQQQT